MPTVITHAAVPLCLGLGLGTKVIPPRLLFAGIVLAMLPDADVLAFKFGVAYGNIFGHRGFTHSLLFALVVPILCVLAGRRWFRASLTRCWLFLTVSLLSHSLLDSITTGGKGVGWLCHGLMNASLRRGRSLRSRRLRCHATPRRTGIR